jgi:hypothetical protein
MLPASLIAPMDLSFLPNLLYFTLPPLAVAGLAGVVCWRGAALLGSACVLSAYLCLYGVWTSMSNPADGLAWLGYLLSMPGAGLGGLIGALIARDYRDRGPCHVALICAGGCLAGLLINQTGLCMSVMYCSIQG